MSEPISKEDWWRIATNLDSGYTSVSDAALLYDECRRLQAELSAARETISELQTDNDLVTGALAEARAQNERLTTYVPEQQGV